MKDDPLFPALPTETPASVAPADPAAIDLHALANAPMSVTRATMAQFPVEPPAVPEFEGPCPEKGCTGTVESKPAENCSCHISAPCGWCTDAPLWCPTCKMEWEA